jgi:hypothetical protein
LLKSFSAENYDVRPPAAETLPFPFVLSSITEIDLKGIVLTPREATSLSGTNRRKGELARVLCGQANLSDRRHAIAFVRAAVRARQRIARPFSLTDRATGPHRCND